MPDEAAQLFALIRGDFVLSQIFFELGREAPDAPAAAPLPAVGLGDLLRHTRLGSMDRLGSCLDEINRAFQAVRNDPEAMLSNWIRPAGTPLRSPGDMPQHPPVMGAALCRTDGIGSPWIPRR